MREQVVELSWDGNNVITKTGNPVIFKGNPLTKDEINMCKNLFPKLREGISTDKIDLSSGDAFYIFGMRFLILVSNSGSSYMVIDLYKTNTNIGGYEYLSHNKMIQNNEIDDYMKFLFETKLYKETMLSKPTKIMIESDILGCIELEGSTLYGNFIYESHNDKDYEMGSISKDQNEYYSGIINDGFIINFKSKKKTNNFQIQKGGAFYKKYLKYKSKYLQIK